MQQPPLVTRARALAASLGFEKSCAEEDGALLHVLAARRATTRVAEIGTGCGVGSAWIVSGLSPGTPFYTSEIDPVLAAAASTLFADDENAFVLTGPWRDTLPPEAPFDLVFVDANDAKDDVDAVVGLLAPGGTVLLDDFGFDPALPDARRDTWLSHPMLTVIELWVTRDRRALVGVRR